MVAYDGSGVHRRGDAVGDERVDDRGSDLASVEKAIRQNEGRPLRG
jgi:hypothetical protein